MRIRRNPLRMMGLPLCAAVPAQIKAPPAEVVVLPPPSSVPAPPASAHVDIHTAQQVLPATAPMEVCLQSCAWTHAHMLNPENLNDDLLGDAWREPRENPGLASENVNIVFLLKRKKVEDNIGEQEQQQEEEVNVKLKRDGSSTQQKKDCSNKKMTMKAIKKEVEEEEEVNKKMKQDGSSQQKKDCSNKKMMAKNMNIKDDDDDDDDDEEEEEEEEEEEVNKKLKRDRSSQRKKGCSNKKMTVKVNKEGVATANKPSQCKRSDGRNWRCSERPALPHTLCENHLHKSRLSYNKRKEARSKSALQKASAISFEADLWKAPSSSKRVRTSVSSSLFSTRATTLMSNVLESSKEALPPPSPTGASSSSKRQLKKKKKGDDYSSEAFHYPELFGPFRGKQRGNYSNTSHVEASSIASDIEAPKEALKGMANLGSKVVTGRGSA